MKFSIYVVGYIECILIPLKQGFCTLVHFIVICYWSTIGILQLSNFRQLQYYNSGATLVVPPSDGGGKLDGIVFILDCTIKNRGVGAYTKVCAYPSSNWQPVWYANNHHSYYISTLFLECNTSGHTLSMHLGTRK